MCVLTEEVKHNEAPVSVASNGVTKQGPQKLAKLQKFNVVKISPKQVKPPQEPSYAPVTGNKEAWMIAAGIPRSDWQYVNCVIAGCDGVSAEGGWDGVQKWNTAGSGAYGLCQALPGSKMASAGPDWKTNPVTQLKWCNSYAQSYGGWAKAWEFRKCVGRCFSTKPGVGWIYKNHTWW